MCQNFLPFKGWIIFHCMYILNFAYPFIRWWTLELCPCFSYCEITLLWTWVYKYLFGTLLLVLPGIYPEVELLYHMVILIFLIFWGTAIVFSIVAVPFYIPTNSAQGFQFLHIVANICYFLFIMVSLKHKNFNVDAVYRIFLLWIMLFVWYLRILCLPQGHEDFLLF